MGTTYTPQVILSGFRSTDIISDELARISADLAAKVDRNGVAPNQMMFELDMNSHRILNLADGVLGSDATNLSQVTTQINAAVAAAGGFTTSATSGDPITFNFGVAVGSQGTSGNTVFNLNTLFGVTAFLGLTVIVNGVVQIPGLAYSISSIYIVTFSESVGTTSDIMFIYGDLSPTPVLPNILADAVGYDIASFFSAKPAASDICIKFVATQAYHLPQNLTLSQAHAEASATASTVFDVKKNGSNVGTITFAAAGTVATFVMASQTNFVAGDRLTVVAPASPDATLANIGFDLHGVLG